MLLVATLDEHTSSEGSGEEEATLDETTTHREEECETWRIEKATLGELRKRKDKPP
jgi:hypothetical protein